MFEKIINLIKQRTKVNFDASVFNDPFATQIEWSPAARGGANFRTHKLVQININRIEFKAGLFLKFFAGSFTLFGIMFATIIPFVILKQQDVNPLFMIIPLLFGSIFALIGYFIYKYSCSPRVFDKGMGFYWKGSEEPNQMINPEYQKYIKLNEIHAIQLISEWVRGNKTSYTSYELNIVMKDKRRINVIDHGNLKSIREDTSSLAEFLNVPVWDATGERK
ncbi:MAG: hypothetical protein KKD38_06495 [Candidatus Delongbacteria bacterium]|nr:hypothetical protein [Candidatus Delongbacteria bacterium]MCG2760298.1 hypothetical protein [Candidatus Delongbacteria bacterium]